MEKLCCIVTWEVWSWNLIKNVKPSYEKYGGFLRFYSFFIVYNVECWSLTAMKREVADTPGRFAMASVWEIFVENV